MNKKKAFISTESSGDLGLNDTTKQPKITTTMADTVDDHHVTYPLSSGGSRRVKQYDCFTLNISKFKIIIRVVQINHRGGI
jgi:hypothetical protein